MSYVNLIMFSSVLPSFDDEQSESSQSGVEKESKKTQGLGFGEFMGLMKGL